MNLSAKSHQAIQPLDAQISRQISPPRDAENDRANHRGSEQLFQHAGRSRRAGSSAGIALTSFMLTLDTERQHGEQHHLPQHEVDRESG